MGVALAVAVVFGGLMLGRYMMCDRPLPTQVAAATPAEGPPAGASATWAVRLA